MVMTTGAENAARAAGPPEAASTPAALTSSEAAGAGVLTVSGPGVTASSLTAACPCRVLVVLLEDWPVPEAVLLGSRSVSRLQGSRVPETFA